MLIQQLGTVLAGTMTVLFGFNFKIFLAENITTFITPTCYSARDDLKTGDGSL